MSTRGRNALKELEQNFSVLDSLYTLLIFVLFITFMPCIVFLYFVVATCRIAWLRFLEQRFPDLEFIRTTSVRTCVDTIRNQGIITLLLQVKGECIIDQLKAQIKNEILDRVKDGRLVFPHLSMALTSRYGRYAWIPKSGQYFNLDNHIVLANPTFRGGPVTNSNIQEYISDIVSKYLPADIPPWQITVINCHDGFYLLIRLHHLYPSEDNLGLGDLLMLKPATDMEENYEDRSTMTFNPDSTQHLLAGTFKTPQAIPEVYEHVCETLANSWNEIVSLYDPLENVLVNKKPPTLKSFFMLFLIINVSVMKELSRSNKSDIFRVFKIEADRRGFTFGFLCRSIKTTLSPTIIIHSIISWTWWFFIKFLLHIPVTIMHCIRDTPLYIYWLVLLLRIFHEICYLGKIIYTAPRVLLEEICFPENPGNSHHLQTVSLCGRKVVCWSNPIPLHIIKKIRDVTNSASCEIILSATAKALQAYFTKVHMPIPESVITIARFIPQEGLLKQSSSSSFHSGGGLLCLPLPTNSPINDPVKCLQGLQCSLYQARSHQAALYLASVYQLDYGLLPKVLPTVCARLLLNMLSRRYAVTLTQVDNSSSFAEQQTRRLLWGQEVENIMYWRPPQANISMSLTLMSYGDSVRLGVMTDAQLSNHHNGIANDFCNYINELAVAVGISELQERDH
ncbi:uncharacterized protein LOC142330542 isoform X2 [Lycorma delicatula]